ncbi:hypothetical protein CCP2SC5_2610001 [Azospirillaceae bacterium]
MTIDFTKKWHEFKLSRLGSFTRSYVRLYYVMLHEFKLSRLGSFTRSPVRLYYVMEYLWPRLKNGLIWAFTSNEITNFTYDLTKRNKRHLAYAVAAVTGKGWQEITGYLQEAETDEMLGRVLKRRNLDHFRRFFSDENFQFGRRLAWYAVVRAVKPKVVVETGIDKGLGSALLCAALRRNAEEGFPGRYFGTDIDPNAGYLLGPPYDEFGEILRGDSIESLKALSLPIDVFINDSDHSRDYERQEYDVVSDKLTSAAIVIGDNAHVTDELADFAERTGRHFLFFRETSESFWYPGDGAGFAYR